MHLTLKWLQKHVPEFTINNLETFKHKLDTRLSEVEHIEQKGGDLRLLVIGEVLEVEKHPDSKKLSVCKVNAGSDETRTIVCGAPNVRAGMYSVVCLPGGRVYVPESHRGESSENTMDISERAVAGVKSQGMLCSTSELGMNNTHASIIEVDDTLAPGTEVTELFQDVVIEIENKAVPHRPDVFSHRGIAREISAIFKTPIKNLSLELPSKREDATPVTITNKVPELCPRYTGIQLTDITIKPSPLWLQIALSYAGVKPINNIVDVTNYVMLDVGQPLHAFDLNKVANNEIIIRKARKGEQIETIDHQTRELPEGAIVIADPKQAIGIAGIMGGLNTEIDDTTTNVFLESANFEMYSIRRTSRELGLRSEAVTRFEKGQDPENTLTGLREATSMMVDAAGAVVVGDVMDVYPNPQTPTRVEFDLNSVKRLLGADIEKNRIIDLLESLGFEVEGGEKISSQALNRTDITSTVIIKVPSWRKDIHAGEDIVEEVGRLYGYENITPTLPKRDLQGPMPSHDRTIIHQIKQAGAAAGLQEIYTYSMVGADLYGKTLLDAQDLLTLSNPISPELSFVRNNVVPSILEKAAINIDKYEEFGLHEVSKVAFNIKTKEGLPEQHFVMGAVRVGNDEQQTYAQLKYAFDKINADVLHNQMQIHAPGKQLPAYFHPGKSGVIKLNNEVIGYIGVAHPMVAANFGLESKHIAIMELNLHNVLTGQATALEVQIKPVITQPVAQRDVSFWQKDRSLLDDTLRALDKAEIALVQAIKVIDRFINDDNQTSITLRVTLQAEDHTLTADEIQAAMAQVEKVISKEGNSIR